MRVYMPPAAGHELHGHDPVAHELLDGVVRVRQLAKGGGPGDFAMLACLLAYQMDVTAEAALWIRPIAFAGMNHWLPCASPCKRQ